jgi:hypothetical protein
MAHTGASSFYDASQKRTIAYDAFVHSLFARAKKCLNLSCNKGYDSRAEGIREASDAIRRQDQDRRDIREVKDWGEQQEDMLRMQEARDNEALFEDDVYAYLLTTIKVHLFVVPRIKERALQGGERERAQAYGHKADTLLCHMAFGAALITDAHQEQTRSWYGEAAELEEKLWGRGNARAQVHHKLHDKFGTYFGVAVEAAEGSFHTPSIKKSPEGLILSREVVIDDLLEKLSRAQTPAEKEALIQRLKEL